MKYVLVKCKPQISDFLAEGLSPLSMLRTLHLVHFRSPRAQMQHYFRLLEGSMSSDRPLPFTDITDFWEEASWEDDLWGKIRICDNCRCAEVGGADGRYSKGTLLDTWNGARLCPSE